MLYGYNLFIEKKTHIMGWKDDSVGKHLLCKLE